LFVVSALPHRFFHIAIHRFNYIAGNKEAPFTALQGAPMAIAWKSMVGGLAGVRLSVAARQCLAGRT